MKSIRVVIALSVLVMFLAGCASQEESPPPAEDLYKGAEQRTFYYSFNGESGSFKFQVYKGLNDYLANLSRTFKCSPVCPTNDTMQQSFLDQSTQASELERFAGVIKSKASDRESQARIAINLVQRIPYDESTYSGGINKDRYPYQVLYDGKGVCGEKVRLLAYFLRDLGYGTALLYFSAEQHAALGLKCPSEYSYKGTGYCFIETTSPAIPIYDQGPYPAFGKLSSSPNVMRLSDGDSFDNVGQYSVDAKEWGRLQGLGSQLSEADYAKMKKLSAKYGLDA